MNKNARLEMTLTALSGYRSGVRADVSADQWTAINAIVDGDVDPQAVLALRKKS